MCYNKTMSVNFVRKNFLSKGWLLICMLTACLSPVICLGASALDGLSVEEKKTIRKTATLNALGLPADSRAANTKDGETLYYSKKTNFFYDEFGNVVATGKKEK